MASGLDVTRVPDDPRVARRMRSRGGPSESFVARRLVLGVSAIAVLVGLAVRVWLLAHQPLTGDEAIVALMARQIRHGHLYAFYWGQAYGGVEPYLVALVTAVFGSSAVAVNVSATILTGLSAVMVWSVVRDVVPQTAGWLALPAATAFWVWPEALVWNSTRELGFRGVTMLAGLLSVKFALRWVKSRRRTDALGFGVVAGIGWWSSPEIVYFLLPALLLVLWAMSREHDLRRAEVGALVVPAVAGVCVGSLPWILSNVSSGFASVSSKASPVYAPSSYGQRLEIVLGKTLPMMVGLRHAPGGGWVGDTAGEVIYGLVVVVVACICLYAIAAFRQSPPLAAMAIGCFAFVFINPVFPATTYWTEGLYGVFLVPLLLVTLFGTLGQLIAEPHAGFGLTARYLPLPILILSAASTVVSFADSWLQTPPPTYSNQVAQPFFFKDWDSDPSSTALRAVHIAHAHGIEYAYADYWTAYVLDALSEGQMTVTDTHNDRWRAAYRAVLRARDPAWLFVRPTRAPEAEHAFPRTRIGPDSLSETDFIGTLARLGIGYNTVTLGVLDAIIPARAVTPSMVGLPPPERH